MLDFLSNLFLNKQNKKVLMVTGALALGGAERQLFALVRGLLNRSWDVEIMELVGLAPGQASLRDDFLKIGVSIRPPPDISTFDARNSEAEIPLALLSLRRLFPGNLAYACGTLQRAFEEFEPEIVHCWSDLANLVAGYSASSFGIPRIVLGQRTFPPSFYLNETEADLYRNGYRTLLRNPAIVCLNNSHISTSAYERWLDVPTGSVLHVYNDFLPSSISIRKGADAADCKTRLGLPSDTLVVGGIMRFAPEKDPALWLETAALVAAQRPNAHFVLAGYGHGDVAEQLFRRGMELGFGNRLIMPGSSHDVGAIYSALDVFLLTSRTENIPNVLIEAQAAGVPTVSPDVGGVSETISDGATGYLIRERSAGALAAAVLRVLDQRHVLSEGPAWVAKRFAHDRMVRATLGVYAGKRRRAVQLCKPIRRVDCQPVVGTW